METVLQVGFSNAVVGGLLALTAAVGSILFRRRPALVHGLWLLVLLKLLTPPLVWINPAWLARSPGLASKPEIESVPTELPSVPSPGRSSEGEQAEAQSLEPAAEQSPPPVEPSPVSAGQVSLDSGVRSFWPGWYELLPRVWLAGTCAWFAVAVLRAARFRHLMGYARPAPPFLQAMTGGLAEDLGLRRCPSVFLVPGRLAPMLWAFFSRPRLLIPEGLLERVGPEQQATLLLHELAHLRRRDHWVRGVEFLATGLYWWHPAVWFVCRELRDAEEQCCDAWVVSTLPGAGRLYATALVETLDFLSAAPAAVPPLACGLGQVSDLKRRLTMIMHGTTPRALGWGGGLAVLGLAALLPLAPGWALADDEESATVTTASYSSAWDESQADEPRQENLENVAAEIKRAQAELEKKMAEVQAMREKLRAVAERARAEARHRAEAARELARAEAAGQVARARTAKAPGGKEVLILEGGKTGEAKKIVLKGTVEIEQTPDGKVIVRSIDTGRSQEGRGEVRQSRIHRIEVHETPPVPPTPGGPARDSRMRDLEKRMESLQRELEALRREMGGRPPGARSPDVPPGGLNPFAATPPVAPPPPTADFLPGRAVPVPPGRPRAPLPPTPSEAPRSPTPTTGS